MTDSAIIERLDAMTSAFVHLSRLVGDRLTRAQMCDRPGISGKTPAPTDAALWDAWRTAVDTTDPTQGDAA